MPNPYDKFSFNVQPTYQQEGSPLVQFLGKQQLNTAGLVPQMLQSGAQQGNFGSRLVGDASRSVGPAGSFYSRLMSGDRGMLDQLFGPEMQRYLEAIHGKTQEVANTQPRSGTRASTMAGLPYEGIKQQNQMYARSPELAMQGAQGMQGIAALLAQMGIGQGQQALSKYGLGLEANSQLLQSLLNQRGQNTQTDMNNRSLIAHGLSQVASGFL